METALMPGRRWLPLALVAGLVAAPATADTIHLKNGRVIHTRSVRVVGETVRFEQHGGRVTLPLSVVDRVVRDGRSEARGRGLRTSGAVKTSTPTDARDADRRLRSRAPAVAAAEQGALPEDLLEDAVWGALPRDPETPEYWRARKRWILARIARVERELARLPEYDFAAERILDGRILWVIEERRRLEERLARRRHLLAAFEEHARRAGVPPGWLRERGAR